MKTTQAANQTYIGIALAVLATIVWSGNFIVAKGIAKEIPPISLAFYRWASASLILFPFTYRSAKKEFSITWKHKGYLFWTALAGVTVFNTLVYFAGHHSSAINMALIGTTSSPVFSIVLAAVFLGETIRPLRIAGLILCLIGIVTLIAQGSWEKLMAFHFSQGDVLILLGGFSFAVYNILARRKPQEISARNFLFIIFSLGALLLLPAYLWEVNVAMPVAWRTDHFFIIGYLGLGTSVIAFLCWNASIARLGAARTALFGNLIPVFASLEALWILGEQITWIHLVSGITVIAGLVLANIRSKK